MVWRVIKIGCRFQAFLFVVLLKRVKIAIRRKGMDMSLLKGINVVSISVTDLVKGRDFYSKVLELGEPVIDLPDFGWIEFKFGADSGHVSLTKAEEGWQPGGGITIVMDVDDCAAACKALRAKGVRCDDPVTIPNMITYFDFYDPFGNRLEGCSAPPAG